MINFTGWQWLLIDAANQYGHDKLTFEKRIEWAEDNIDVLDQPEWVVLAETKPLYIKAVMAIRKAQQGIPTGHMVGVDAICSGVQIMSVMTGCVSGARATGLIDPDDRSDAYSAVTTEMGVILGGAVNVSRSDAKDATMHSFYGSKKSPKNIFGEDTPELSAFYQAAKTVAPGAWELLQDLLASWQPYALSHNWKLPDGFDARVKVMVKHEVRLEVDELDHATFTYEFFENEGSKTGLSNVANMTHSMDAYILREMHRRCNYDRDNIVGVALGLRMECNRRALVPTALDSTVNPMVAYFIDQYQRSTLASAAILPHLDDASMSALSQEHLEALAIMVDGMLDYQPFELVTVHDEFKAHANNINHVRYQYKEILAEIADSNVLDDLLSQVTGTPGTFPKLSFNLGDQIRKSNYALC
jgi:DNA-dependent RNA polymerase